MFFLTGFKLPDTAIQVGVPFLVPGIQAAVLGIAMHGARLSFGFDGGKFFALIPFFRRLVLLRLGFLVVAVGTERLFPWATGWFAPTPTT
ncbi:MAG: hypothetical protein JNM11_12705 [Chitinimonas sp.]|nr:hypothetical protein [Chitinimonas sp.]